jgi:transposase
MTHLNKSRRQLFEELDQPELRPLPKKPYEFATWITAKVNIDYHVAFEKHLYSVPHTLIHQQVEIRTSERMVEIFHKGQQVALHPRRRTTGRFTTRSEHMPDNHRFVLGLNADWLLRQAQEIGPQTFQYLTALLQSRTYPEQAYRSCLGVLSLARKHPRSLLEVACQRLQTAHLLSYGDLKSELEALARQTPLDQPPTVHENIRGETYYH